MLARRLRSRGTETEAQFARRLQTAQEEMASRDEFDEVVVNDDVQVVVGRLVELMVGPGFSCAERSAGTPPIPATGVS